MLSLLSRAGQSTHPSRCLQCLRHAQEVARQAATAGSVLRPRHRSICRAWSPCNGARAAVSGTGNVIQKREQWTQAVDEDPLEPGSLTREGNRTQQHGIAAEIAMEQQSPMGAQELGGTCVDGEYEGSTHTDTESMETPEESLDVSDDLEAELERNLDSTAEREHLPSWPTNTGPPLQRHHLPPQSIYAYQGKKRGAAKLRWYEKKVLRVELAMDMLQLKFFMWLQARGRAYRLVSTVPESYAAHVLQHRSQLRRVFAQKKADFDRLLSTHRMESGDFVFERSRGDVPLCHYSEDEAGIFRTEQRELQRTIKRAFNHLAAPDMPGADIPGTAWALRLEALVSIFWQLSASPAPPSLDIFNTLIHGLRKEGYVELTESVISCFVNSRMRPNEVSLAAILGFYTENDNLERFGQWVRLMRGQMGGLMAAAPWLLRFEASNGRIIRREDKPDVLIQLPYPTPMVFDALVKGVLHFGGFGDALELCRNLTDEGWGMDMHGFGILLNDCAIRGDWDSGFAIWKQVLALKQKSGKFVNGQIRTVTIMTPLFADMLRLCRRCDKKDEFKDVWEQASATHPKAVKRIMNRIRAESASTASRPAAAKADTATAPASQQESTAETDAVSLAEHREQTLEALARLRAGNMDDTTDRALRQEYLALHADVEFLKALEANGESTKPKAYTWADLAKAAYSLIATHPEMLERRTPKRKHWQDRRAKEKAQTVSLIDMAKSAYHLVADPSSAFGKLPDRTLSRPPIASAESRGGQPLSMSPRERRSGELRLRFNRGPMHDLAGTRGDSAQDQLQGAQIGEAIKDESLSSNPTGVERPLSHSISSSELPRAEDNVTTAQLHGHEGGSQELDDYEAGKRPMSQKRS